MERTPIALRFALLCLLGLALLMPLTPQAVGLVATKHIVFLALAALGALGLVVATARGTVLPALGTPTDGALIAFLGAAALAALFPSNPGMTRYAAGVVLATGLTYLLAIKTLRTPADVRRLARAVLLAGLVIALWGLYHYRRFLGDGAPETQRSAYLATNLFAHSYLAAQYLVMVLVGGVVLLFERGVSRTGALGVTLALVPIGGFLLVIGSRGAYLAVVVALLVHLALRARAVTEGRGRSGQLVKLLARAAGFAAAGLVLIGVLTVTGLLPGAAQHALQRVLLVFDPAASEFNFSRLDIWRNTLAMAGDHVLLGVGPGGFDTTLPSYHYSARPVPHAHNQFLHVLAEIGLVGLAAFGFLLGHAIHAVRKGTAFLAADSARRPLFHAAVAALTAALTYFLFETPLAWPEAGSLIMILLAVVTRAGCESRERAGRPVLAGLGVLGLGLLLAVIAPVWVDYNRAMAATSRHLHAVDAAKDARRLGQTTRADVQLAKAAILLDEADEVFPWRPDFQALRADLLYARGRYAEALAACRIADERAPGSFRNLNTMGLILLKLDRPAEAIDPLRRAIHSHRGPEAAESYVALSRAFVATGRWEEAWLILASLLGPGIHYDAVQPSLLLDAVRTLLHLDRNLHEARPLLAIYRERVPPERRDHAQVTELEGWLEEALARPRRQILR